MTTLYVREWREKRALSKAELARLMGVHRATIGRIEAGQVPFPRTRRRLAAALGVTPEELAARPARQEERGEP